ncbi:MAG: hypothetical protein ACKVZ6_21540 [Kineosporiaceae bacterium]|jgi:GABA permease
MRNILIVANQTLGGNELQKVIKQRAESGECDFWVVVPATATADLAVPPRAGARNLDDEGTALAEGRLATELDRLKVEGVRAAGEIGDPDPIRAIQDTMAVRQFDEIILATLPQGVSRWLRQDLVHRARRKFSVPLTHVVSA